MFEYVLLNLMEVKAFFRSSEQSNTDILDYTVEIHCSKCKPWNVGVTGGKRSVI